MSGVFNAIGINKIVDDLGLVSWADGRLVTLDHFFHFAFPYLAREMWLHRDIARGMANYALRHKHLASRARGEFGFVVYESQRLGGRT